MNKVEKLISLKNIFTSIVNDNIVSPAEINLLQDWVDENAVYFVGEQYNGLIIPLQRFIEDGRLTQNEINDILNIINIETT